MTARQRAYRPDTDFLAVRDLLAEHYEHDGRRLNWHITRWEYARHFVTPMIGTRHQYDPSPEESMAGIRFWEALVGIWEDGGQVVGAVCTEYPWRGDAFIQRHPAHDDVLGRMLAYAEEHLSDPETRTVHVFVCDHDVPLLEAVRERGYVRNDDRYEDVSEYDVRKLPPRALPDGFEIRSVADELDIERRRAIFGLGFDHEDPAEWPSAFAYAELMRAPDYRRDLDLFVVAPDGEYVSSAIIWFDPQNRSGILEPVCTHPDHRRRGLGREVVLEGIRRAAALGARRAIVDTAMQFYLSFGFEPKFRGHYWRKDLRR
jgi:predicted N-acetyltransferase YhbS